MYNSDFPQESRSPLLKMNFALDLASFFEAIQSCVTWNSLATHYIYSALSLVLGCFHTANLFGRVKTNSGAFASLVRFVCAGVKAVSSSVLVPKFDFPMRVFTMHDVTKMVQ